MLRGTMFKIETTATVTADGLLTIQVPTNAAPGEHHVVVLVEEYQPSNTERPPLSFPEHDTGVWPEGFSVRREELYDDAGH